MEHDWDSDLTPDLKPVQDVINNLQQCLYGYCDVSCPLFEWGGSRNKCTGELMYQAEHHLKNFVKEGSAMKSIDGHKLLEIIKEAVESLPQVVTKDPPDMDTWSAWKHDDNFGDICTLCKYPNPDSFRGQYCSCCGRRMQNADAQQMLVREREVRRKYNDLCNR